MKTFFLTIIALFLCMISCRQEGSSPEVVPQTTAEEPSVSAQPVPSPASRAEEYEVAVDDILASLENANSPKQEGNTVLALSFQRTLDMGWVYANEMKHGEFFVKNVSNAPETIREVAPTCECITLDREYHDVTIQPGEELLIGFTMRASTVQTKEYGRYIFIKPMSSPGFKARVGGRIRQAVTITPKKCVKMGLLKNPATPWKHTFHIKGVDDLPETLVLGDPMVHPNVNCEITQTAPGEYDCTLTPKGSLPYVRQFHPFIHIPILKPAAATELVLELDAQVGEAVNFAPDKWPISKEYLEEEGSFTERFVYGEVPGIQEERKAGDPASDLKNMMKTSLLKQHNAVPLKFVKEHHDWDDLFGHIQFRVPQGVTLEKIRHPQGIELKITVTTDAFAETDTVQVVPYRDRNDMSPITIQVVEE